MVVTATLPHPGTEPLSAAGLAVDQCAGGAPDRDELTARFAAASGAITTPADSIDADLLASSPNLRVVANIAVGYDNIDLQAASDLGIVVTNTPEVLTEAVGDLAWALVLAAARRVVEGDTWVRTGSWPGWTPDQLLGQSVFGKVIAIVGMGRIGTAIGRRARGFDMEILTCSRTPRPDLEASVGGTRVPLAEALARADVVVITAPLNAESLHLIDAPALALMKPSAVLVNVGRGPVVDERALIDALAAGRLAAAALDVYEFEPTISEELRAMPNVVLTPHIGSATHETRAAMVSLCCENVIRVLGGEPALTPVALPPPGHSVPPSGRDGLVDL